MQVIHDARIAARRLARSPRFVFAFVLPLALGLGAGATFYSIVHRVLYQPAPGAQRVDELYRIAKSRDLKVNPFAQGNTSVAWLDYEALARQGTTL